MPSSSTNPLSFNKLLPPFPKRVTFSARLKTNAKRDIIIKERWFTYIHNMSQVAAVLSYEKEESSEA
jgi:hypothetical protein